MTGRVLRLAGADTVPLAGAWVVLHGVTAAGGAPVDSVRADRQGRYRIMTARDSGAAYITSVRHLNIAYFGASFGPPAPGAQDVAPIVVFDTSSTAPPIVLAERRVAVLRPEPDGSHRVVEFLRLANRGNRTRVTGADERPTWTGRVAAEPREFQTGPGDVSGDAVAYAGGTVSVFAPISPGERDLLYSYLLPAGTRRVVLPTDQSVDVFEVLLEDDATDVEEGLLRFEGYEALSGATFRSYRAVDVPAGTEFVLRVPGSTGGRGGGWVVWVVVPAAVLAMAVVLTRWFRRTAEPGRVTTIEDTPEMLAGRIAALDAEYAGREDDAYRAQRAELKSRLADALARGRAAH